MNSWDRFELNLKKNNSDLGIEMPSQTSLHIIAHHSAPMNTDFMFNSTSTTVECDAAADPSLDKCHTRH